MPKASNIINMIFIIILATILGIILYIIINFKGVFAKIIDTVVPIVKDKQPVIQPVIDTYAEKTTTNLVENLGADPKFLASTADIGITMANKMLTDETLKTNVATALVDIINKPSVTSALGGVITNSLGGVGAGGGSS